MVDDVKSPLQTLLATLGINIDVAAIQKQAEAIIAGTQQQAALFTAQLQRLENKLDAICTHFNIEVTDGSATTNNGDRNAARAARTTNGAN
jgi:hypothetical protein